MFTGNKNGPCFKSRDGDDFPESGGSPNSFGDYQMKKYSPEVWALKRPNESWLEYSLRCIKGQILHQFKAATQGRCFISCLVFVALVLNLVLILEQLVETVFWQNKEMNPDSVMFMHCVAKKIECGIQGIQQTYGRLWRPACPPNPFVVGRSRRDTIGMNPDSVNTKFIYGNNFNQ